MKRNLLVSAVVLVGVALCAKSPDASSVHFVVANDGAVANSASVFKLSLLSNPTLTLEKTLPTGGNGINSTGGLPETVVIQHGTDVCIYISDPSTADVAAWVYPTFARVGRYKIPGVKDSGFGMGVVARGNFLFASYSQSADPLFSIATWSVGSGCALTLATTFDVPGSPDGMALSPNGQTLVVTYAYPLPSVDSFTVATDGSLTEHGPYGGPFDTPTGVDITADSKYAIIGEIDTTNNDATQIGIYAINSDGSLGTYITYGGGSLGPGKKTGYVWLSPNEKFLFVSGGGPRLPITTLNFNEGLQQVTYAGCAVDITGNATGLATAQPSGAGGALYVAEYGNNAGHKAKVALFSIDSSTGCLTQATGSPFTTHEEGSDFSVAAWPPRPF